MSRAALAACSPGPTASTSPKRTAYSERSLSRTGRALSMKAAGNEAAGDLVFFGSAKNKIGRVGIMINATTWQRPVVQISRLDEAHWKELYQGARRAKK